MGMLMGTSTARKAGASDATAMERAEQIAAGLQQRDPRMTRAKAIARAFEQNPKLYTEYLRERGEA